MKKISFRFPCLIAVFLLACGGGCSSNTGGVGPGMDPQEAVLKELADLMRTVTSVPAKIADLTKSEPMFPKSYSAVKNGDIIVLWGTPMMGEGSIGKGGGVIVAYEKAAPDAGGWVLKTDGTVLKASADEVKSAAKAKK